MWLQAYEFSLEKGNESEDAIRYADMLIDRTLGSGRKYDQAAISRSGELAKVLSMFFSFINTEYNRWAFEVGNVQLNEAQKARFFGFLVSRLIIFQPLSLFLSGKGPDDDESYLKWLARMNLGYLTSFFPVVRDIATIVIDHSMGRPSFGYRPSPVVSAVQSGIDVSSTAIDYFVDGDIDGQRFAESLTKCATYMMPYPAQIDAWMWNAYDASFNGMTPQLSDLYKRRPRKER
jgi:hypothetical protein